MNLKPTICRRAILLATSAALAVLIATRAAGEPIAGIYGLAEPDHPIPRDVLENQNVDGVALRCGWKELEPREGEFDWSAIDHELAAAHSRGKKVSLGIAAGIRTPKWVYEAGAAQFRFKWDKPFGHKICSDQAIPVPWDPVFLSKWRRFVRALGARYSSAPTLVYVKINGINGTTQEAILPHEQNRPIEGPGESCSTGDELAEWRRLGYTKTRMEEAWKTIAEAFAESFPDKKIGTMWGPRGFPRIDSYSRFMPGSDSDMSIPPDLISFGISNYGTRFVVQNNGLSTFRSWPLLDGLADRVTVGYQMAWAATGDPTCRMNKREAPCDPAVVLNQAIDRGLRGGAKFLEIYIEDLENPSLQDTIAAAHRRLTQR